MGCGASSSSSEEAGARYQAAAPHDAAYEVFERKSAHASMPPGVYDARVVTDDADSVIDGPPSRDGRHADEPSAFALGASRSVTVALARFRHGVDADPEQYVPPRESPATIQRSTKMVESWLRAQRRFQQRELRRGTSSRRSSSSVKSDGSVTMLASSGGFASLSSLAAPSSASDVGGEPTAFAWDAVSADSQENVSDGGGGGPSVAETLPPGSVPDSGR